MDIAVIYITDCIDDNNIMKLFNYNEITLTCQLITKHTKGRKIQVYTSNVIEQYSEKEYS